MDMVHDQETHNDLENSSIPNQPVQVQSVIQSNQHSVIQATGQVEDEGEGSDGRTRREILARRPSYRKILNDLSSDGPSIPGVSKIDEETSQSSPESQESESQSQTATSQYQTEYVSVVPAGAIQIAAHGDNSAQGLQTLTMTNASGGSSGATIVQYAQGPDGQFFIPGRTLDHGGYGSTAVAGAGGVQAYQITSAANLPQGVQGVVMATAGALSSQQMGQMGEEASRKRELRLLKNREAAKECRRKKKEYVKCLENRVAVLENQNKALIEELKSLKELYCQKEVVGP